ncbi:MAG: organoarsenical effux MFS transporter ArsJ [Gammaproteobacteria bacterium]|nr:organoarsenical effux MFS transporter ArsJ [Gammaproteobacteria bacterium]
MTSLSGMRNYFIITAAYWGFTITDGAIRMLVVLYFHQIGYSPLEIALLFLFYEFFGVVTNLVGGWLGARIGLNKTIHIGMGLQVLALSMLTVPDAYLSVAYVMFAQALSGIAKDLNKMSAKASVKLMLPQGDEQQDSRLFKWVAVLTGSKNSLKGAGFFIGGALLSWVGFRTALAILAGSLFALLVLTYILLPQDIGKTKDKAKFSQVFSKTPAINWLSAARFFLFGSRDVWFVVGLPVFLAASLGWEHSEVGAFLALWIIGYGVVQVSAPRLLRRSHHNRGPDGSTSRWWVFSLALFPAAIAIALQQSYDPSLVLIAGLALFGIVFAINSAIHSYLILAYSDNDKVSMNVGFYYMANAGGRLVGTLLSGWSYQTLGLTGCLWISTVFVVIAGFLSFGLPRSEDTADRQPPQ